MSEIMNYDPNLTCSGNMASQVVRLTFGLWQYRSQMDVTIGGNCMGLDDVSAAVSAAYEALEQRNIRNSNETYSMILLVDSNDPGQELECCDDDPDCATGDDWLGNMLIAAEIISITPK